MEELFKSPLFIYILLPIIVGLSSYLIRNILIRLDNIEKILPLKQTEEQVRQLLSDKLDPIKEDIREVNAKLDKMLDVLLKK